MEPKEYMTYDLYLDRVTHRHYMNHSHNNKVIQTHIQRFGYIYSKAMQMLCVDKPYSTEYLLLNVLLGIYNDIEVNSLILDNEAVSAKMSAIS